MRAARGRGGRTGGDAIGRGSGGEGRGETQIRKQRATDPSSSSSPSASTGATTADQRHDDETLAAAAAASAPSTLAHYEQRKDAEAEHLLTLGSATSTYASQIPVASYNNTADAAADSTVVVGSANNNNNEPQHFLGSASSADTQALCSRMARALEILPRSQRLRLPQHLVETIYGRSEAVAAAAAVVVPTTAIDPRETISQSASPLYSADTSLSSVGDPNSIQVAASDETVQAGNHPVAAPAFSMDLEMDSAVSSTTTKVIEVTDLTSAPDTSEVVYLGTKHVSSTSASDGGAAAAAAGVAASSGDSMDKWLDSTLKKVAAEEEDLDAWLDTVIS